MINIKQKLGFTLIELLVVTTIIIILSTIGLVSYRTTGKNARDSKRRADLETVRQALVLYRSDVGTYPSGTYDNITATLNGAGYLSLPIPRDPRYPDRVYSYSGGGATFTLTVTLENDESDYLIM